MSYYDKLLESLKLRYLKDSLKLDPKTYKKKEKEAWLGLGRPWGSYSTYKEIKIW